MELCQALAFFSPAPEKWASENASGGSEYDAERIASPTVLNAQPVLHCSADKDQGSNIEDEE